MNEVDYYCIETERKIKNANKELNKSFNEVKEAYLEFEKLRLNSMSDREILEKIYIILLEYIYK